MFPFLNDEVEKGVKPEPGVFDNQICAVIGVRFVGVNG